MSIKRVLFAWVAILLAAATTQTINIYAAELGAQLSKKPLSNTLPMSVTLLLDVAGGVPPYTVQIDFGDTSTPSSETINNNPVPNGFSYEVLHTYNTAAEFTVSASITDNNSETVSDDFVLDLKSATPSTTLYEVSGRIVNTSDTKPLKGTTVSYTSNTGSPIITLDDGRFTFIISNGSYTLSADNNGVTPTTQPTFTVANASQDIGDIEINSYTTQIPAPLPRIQTLAISSVGEDVVIDWSSYLVDTLTDEEDIDNLMHYKVYLSQTSFTDVTSLTPLTTVSTDKTTHTASGLAVDKTYYFAVTAYDRFGQQYSTGVNTGNLFLEKVIVPTINEWGITLLIILIIFIFKKDYINVTKQERVQFGNLEVPFNT